MLASSKVVPGRQSSSREDLTASLTKQLNPSASAAVPTAPTDAEKRAMGKADERLMSPKHRQKQAELAEEVASGSPRNAVAESPRQQRKRELEQAEVNT